MTRWLNRVWFLSHYAIKPSGLPACRVHTTDTLAEVQRLQNKYPSDLGVSKPLNLVVYRLLIPSLGLSKLSSLESPSQTMLRYLNMYFGMKLRM